MNKRIDELEDIQIELDVTKDLTTILDEHFQTQRFKNNKLMDYYSIQRLFKEYGTLNWVISTKLDAMQNKLGKTIIELNKIERK